MKNFCDLFEFGDVVRINNMSSRVNGEVGYIVRRVLTTSWHVQLGHTTGYMVVCVDAAIGQVTLADDLVTINTYDKAH